MILYVGTVYDLIFGLNRMDAGLTILILLFLLVPLLNLSWLITEIILSVKLFRHRAKALAFLVPLIAVFFFIESIAIDLFLLSQARM
jgi:hypothetical protein